jgi:hypothetical protein
MVRWEIKYAVENFIGFLMIQNLLSLRTYLYLFKGVFSVT